MINQYAIKLDKELTREQLKKISFIVTEQRRQKAERFLKLKDKERCLISEALLIYALQNYYLMSRDNISFVFSEYGKPFLENCDLNFNFSHSGNWVVCSIGEKPTGIDVEKVRFLDYGNICKAFSEFERLYFENLKTDERQNTFFKLWTLKESFVKFNGSGLHHSFKDFSIDVARLALVGGDVDTENLAFCSEKLDEEHWYALCYNSRDTVNEIHTVSLNDLLNFSSNKNQFVKKI